MAGALAAVVVAGIVAVVFAATAGPAPPFAWLRPLPAPATWSVARAADGAVLSFPPALEAAPSDPGAATAQAVAGDGTYVGYANATPWSGPAPGEGWGPWRLDHLSDDDEQVRQLAAARGLAMLGGAKASCATDRYVTRVGRHPFTEIACLVQPRHGQATVLVVATSTSRFGRSAPMLEQVVDAFRA